MPLIGPVAPGAHMVHRARAANDRRPVCGHVSHGRVTEIVEVLGKPMTESAEDARAALIAHGEKPCRLCRRCWRSRDHATHERICWRKS